MLRQSRQCQTDCLTVHWSWDLSLIRTATNAVFTCCFITQNRSDLLPTIVVMCSLSSVCLSVCLPVCMSVCTVCAVCSESLDLKISFLLCDAFVRTNHHAVAIMFVCLSVRLSVRLSVCLFVRLSVWHVHAL